MLLLDMTYVAKREDDKTAYVVVAGKAEYSAADDGLCEQRLSGTIKIPFVNVQIADGVLVVHEEIG